MEVLTEKELWSKLESVCDSVLTVKDSPGQEGATPESLASDLNKRISWAEKVFDELRDVAQASDKGRFSFLLGKMYNASPIRRQQAADCLARAVKLHPNLIDAWNELGECYFFLGDPSLAAHCFRGALERQSNKVSLRNLSMVCRKQSFSVSGKEREALVRQGIVHARKALNLDPVDGESWAILGNSYLALNLAGITDMQATRLALQAYKHAERNGGASPELLYNRGVALLFCEDFDQAFEALDASLALDPAWPLALETRAKALRYLLHIQENTDQRGKLGRRRLTQFGRTTAGWMPPVGVPTVSLSALVEGMNAEVAAAGAVAWSIPADGCMPFAFGLVDSAGDAIVVTVFGMAAGRGPRIGDIVAVPKPQLRHEQFFAAGKQFDFLKIRVQHPTKLFVSSRFLGLDSCADCAVLTSAIK